jgi:hypothetical protein
LNPCSSLSGSTYAADYPIPHQKDQPPHKALRTSHPVSCLYDTGLLETLPKFTLNDVHSLLPGCNQVDIPLDKGDHARKCAEGLHTAQWFTVEMSVPFVQTLSMSKDESLEWTGTPRLRTTSQGPLFGVKHSIRASVTLTYDGADDTERASSTFITFTLPVNFVRLRGASRPCTPPAPHPQSPSLDQLSSSDPSSVAPAAVPPMPPYHTPELPAYSQLFYPNGAAKHDDSIPLPLYTPSPSSSPPTLSEVCEQDKQRLSSEASCLLPDSSSSNSSSSVHNDAAVPAAL